ncbi:MAG: hypothetical protein AAF409_19505 [Pseudomonadota bacterium]
MPRPLLLLTALLIGLLPVTADLRAEVACPNPLPSSSSRPQVDRCRADYIDIFTANNVWQTLKEGQRICFRPPSSVWQWKCQGYAEAARCRGLRSKKAGRARIEVMAELRDNQVIWTCYDAQEEK